MNSNTGRKLSKEHKKKLSLARLGKIPWNKGLKGVHFSPATEFKKGQKLNLETRSKISQTLKRIGHKPPPSKRENHWNWKGGICDSKQYLSWVKNSRNRLKMKAEGSHSFTDWETLKAQYNWTCLFCKKKEPVIKLTEDHIIPLSKGGSDNIENIQPLCQKCNSKKSNKLI